MMMTRLVMMLALGAAACGGGNAAGECNLNVASDQIDASFDHGSVDALIEAGGRFSAEVTSLDAKLREACTSLGAKLGASAGTTTQTACDNMRAALAAKLAASPGVALHVAVTPPVCTASAMTTIACVADCDASFDATATPPTCTGGMLSGQCSGSCSGECTASGSVSCSAECSGTCSGSCTGSASGSCAGTCNGQCSGACSVTASDGSCAGTCTGTCSGTCSGTLTGECSGTCSGSCSGDCRSTVSGSCSGTCSGQCSVAFTEPTCEGGHFEVQADADCAAACEAQGSFDLVCTDPQVVVTYTGTGSATDLAAITLAIQTDYPKIVDVAVRLGLIVSSTTNLAAAVNHAASDATRAGVQAVLCLAEATDAAVTAAGTVNADVQITVQVQGSISTGP